MYLPQDVSDVSVVDDLTCVRIETERNHGIGRLRFEHQLRSRRQHVQWKNAKPIQPQDRVRHSRTSVVSSVVILKWSRHCG